MNQFLPDISTQSLVFFEILHVRSISELKKKKFFNSCIADKFHKKGILFRITKRLKQLFVFFLLDNFINKYIFSDSSLAILASLVDPEGKKCLQELGLKKAKSSKSISIDKYSMSGRNRTNINKEQATFLQNVFEINHFPDAGLRKQLERATGLPGRVIQVWFQNRRRKLKITGRNYEASLNDELL